MAASSSSGGKFRCAGTPVPEDNYPQGYEMKFIFWTLYRDIARARQYEDIVLSFLTQFMYLRNDYRRQLAGNGAVRCRHRKHPIHWRDERLGDTFDAGNIIYEFALVSMWPKMERLKYSRNTLGNIAEGFMAVGMNSQNRAAQSLCRIIEKVAGNMYLVCYEYDIYSLAELDAKYIAEVENDPNGWPQHWEKHCGQSS